MAADQPDLIKVFAEAGYLVSPGLADTLAGLNDTGVTSVLTCIVDKFPCETVIDSSHATEALKPLQLENKPWPVSLAKWGTNVQLVGGYGTLVAVQIYGVRWGMSYGEYYKMCHIPFHYWPHNLKKICPSPHSCARCIHRPFNFQDTKKRTCDPVPPCPNWGWSNAAPYYENKLCEAGEWSE